MPSTRKSALRASPGDRLIIKGHRLGEPDRDAEILEVLGDNGAPPYVVRWDDGHVAEVFPSSDAHVQHVRVVLVQLKSTLIAVMWLMCSSLALALRLRTK